MNPGGEETTLVDGQCVGRLGDDYHGEGDEAGVGEGSKGLRSVTSHRGILRR
jgi:hypothetical protein